MNAAAHRPWGRRACRCGDRRLQFQIHPRRPRVIPGKRRQDAHKVSQRQAPGTHHHPGGTGTRFHLPVELSAGVKPGASAHTRCKAFRPPQVTPAQPEPGAGRRQLESAGMLQHHVMDDRPLHREADPAHPRQRPPRITLDKRLQPPRHQAGQKDHPGHDQARNQQHRRHRPSALP